MLSLQVSSPRRSTGSAAAFCQRREWAAWHAHFSANATRPLPPVQGCDGVPLHWRMPLARSLARFQIGEAGEGRIASEVDRNFAPYIDDDYRQSLKLFVKEEGRHGRILGTMVRACGGTLLQETWTEKLFVVGRRLVGMRHKLIVLQAAEVVGIGVYGLVAQHLGNGALKTALAQIRDDEKHHLAFHAQYFRSAFANASERALFVAMWRGVVAGAIAMVLADHAPLFAAMGLSRVNVAAHLWTIARDAERRALPQHDDDKAATLSCPAPHVGANPLKSESLA